MSEVNQLSLFGLDLSGLHRRVVLGIHQVLWSDEVGLRAWLSPALPTHQLSELERVASDESLHPKTGCQVLLPEAQVLVTRMTLPASAEISWSSRGRRVRRSKESSSVARRSRDMLTRSR